MPEFALKQRFLIFRIGAEQFGISIFEIREVARYQVVKRVPRALPFVKGIIDLRGVEIVPIVDLTDRLGIPALSQDSAQNRFLIAQVEGRPVGLMVSQVDEVVEVDSGEIMANPLGMDAPFIAGVLRLKPSSREREGEGEERPGESRLVFILKMDELFTHEERVHLQEIRDRFLKDSISPSASEDSSLARHS